jgi:hypothetical protein
MHFKQAILSACSAMWYIMFILHTEAYEIMANVN